METRTEYILRPRAIANAIVVDPELPRARLVRDVLRSMGVHRVAIEQQAHLAHNRIRRSSFDVAIIGGNLDNCTSAEFAATLRFERDRPYALMPIIELVNGASKKQLAESIAKGVDEFVSWPLSRGLLRKKVLRFQNRPRIWVHVPSYFGPCRRRMPMLDYDGPERREKSVAYV